MGFSKILATAAVAALSFIAPTAVFAQDMPLPWDGRGQDLTVATLDSKYKLHIFKQRQSGSGDPADYVTVTPKGRSPAFNGDTGVIDIAVDDKAIFNSQTNFRRSELVQNIASASTQFFRASILAPAAIQNKYVWQVFFPESHQWEVFVDATASPMKIQFRTESRVQWDADFPLDTWYNFGIEVASSGITLYTSTGSGALKQVWTDGKAATPSAQELHFGMLTLSNDGSAPKMVATQDKLSFNGVTVDNKVSTDGGSGGSSAATPSTTTAPSPAATKAATSAPSSPSTSSPSTSAPSTSAPSSPTTSAPSPATTSAPSPATTTAPSTPSSPSTPKVTTKKPSKTKKPKTTKTPSTKAPSSNPAPAPASTTKKPACKRRRI